MHTELKHITVQCALISSSAPLPLTHVPHYMAKQDYSNSARLLSTGFGYERSHGLFVQWPTEPPIQNSGINLVDRPCLGFRPFCAAGLTCLQPCQYTTTSVLLVALDLYACHLGVGSWQLHSAVSEAVYEQMMSNSATCMPCHLASCILVLICCVCIKRKCCTGRTQKKVDEFSCGWPSWSDILTSIPNIFLFSCFRLFGLLAISSTTTKCLTSLLF